MNKENLMKNKSDIKIVYTFLDGMKWGILLSCPMWIGLGCLIGKFIWIW